MCHVSTFNVIDAHLIKLIKLIKHTKCHSFLSKDKNISFKLLSFNERQQKSQSEHLKGRLREGIRQLVPLLWTIVMNPKHIRAM